MIKVYQIQLTDAEIDSTAAGREAVLSPKLNAYFGRSFSFKAENFQYYTHVANVHTNDMEDAFRLMNLWEDASKVEKLDRCSSLSVGDVLEMENGERYLCASFGFERI